MNHLRDEFPPILDSIEKIINQMIHQLQETWSEKLIREMRSLVSRLQHIQFQNTIIDLKRTNPDPERSIQLHRHTRNYFARLMIYDVVFRQ